MSINRNNHVSNEGLMKSNSTSSIDSGYASHTSSVKSSKSEPKSNKKITSENQKKDNTSKPSLINNLVDFKNSVLKYESALMPYSGTEKKAKGLEKLYTNTTAVLFINSIDKRSKSDLKAEKQQLIKHKDVLLKTIDKQINVDKNSTNSSKLIVLKNNIISLKAGNFFGNSSTKDVQKLMQEYVKLCKPSIEKDIKEQMSKFEEKIPDLNKDIKSNSKKSFDDK